MQNDNPSYVLTRTDTPSASEHAYQAFPRTRPLNLRASGELTPAQHLLGYPFNNVACPANAHFYAL